MLISPHALLFLRNVIFFALQPLDNATSHAILNILAQALAKRLSKSKTAVHL